MKPYIEWTKEELVAEKARLEQEFAKVKAKGLNLNISRGKPAAAQLDITEGMLTVLSKNEDTFAEDGTDCRNYGVLTGIPEAKKLIGDICEVPAENVIIYGNASLVGRGTRGQPGTGLPWRVVYALGAWKRPFWTILYAISHLRGHVRCDNPDRRIPTENWEQGMGGGL